MHPLINISLTQSLCDMLVIMYVISYGCGLQVQCVQVCMSNNIMVLYRGVYY